MNVNELLVRLERVRRNGKGWSARCPAHDDRNPSLSISEERDNILLCCHAGCSTQAICAVMGITMSDLFERNESTPRIVATYPYTDENGSLLFEVVRYSPKTFRQRRPDGNGGWIWNLKTVRRVPYRLPDVLCADGIIICEGEKDCDTASEMGLVATCNPGGAGKWDPKFGEFMRNKPVVVIADADAPGLAHAHDVARSLIGVSVALRLIEALPQAKDLAEYHKKGGTIERLLQTIEETPVLTAADVAKWTPGKPSAPPLASMPPCTMSGEEILGQLVAMVRRYLALSPSQADVIALWIIHTHAVGAAQSTPYLGITSAEKQCGKTRLLEVLELLVAKPWMTGSVSAAVLFRTIEEMRPTLLLDESDATFNGDPEYAEGLRGVLNSGHRRGGKCSRCERARGEFIRRDFETFCPKAIAGIGKLPGTVTDRCIPIRLRRKLPGQQVARFHRRIVEPDASAIQKQAAAWAAERIATLAKMTPSLPESLSDRQQDGAEPLLAIADAAGGDWPTRGRDALAEIFRGTAAEDQSIGVRLLADIRQIFTANGHDKLASNELRSKLIENEAAPWCEFSNGKAITVAGIARLLNPFEIFPRTIRIGQDTVKGYLQESFRDTWERYVPAAATGPPPCSSRHAVTNRENTG